MGTLAKLYDHSAFPWKANLPAFSGRYPIGPNYALDLSNRLVQNACKAECLDFDTGELSEIAESAEISGYGDCLYLIYNNPEDWIYIYGSDLSWGIVFLNVESTKFEYFCDLDLAREDFYSSFRRRTTDQSQYYDVPALFKWGEIAGLTG